MKKEPQTSKRPPRTCVDCSRLISGSYLKIAGDSPTKPTRYYCLDCAQGYFKKVEPSQFTVFVG